MNCFSGMRNLPDDQLIKQLEPYVGGSVLDFSFQSGTALCQIAALKIQDRALSIYVDKLTAPIEEGGEVFREAVFEIPEFRERLEFRENSVALNGRAGRSLLLEKANSNTEDQ